MNDEQLTGRSTGILGRSPPCTAYFRRPFPEQEQRPQELRWTPCGCTYLELLHRFRSTLLSVFNYGMIYIASSLAVLLRC